MDPSAGSNCGGSQIRKVVGLSGECVGSAVGWAVSVALLSGVGGVSGAGVFAGSWNPAHAEQIMERRSSTRRDGFIVALARQKTNKFIAPIGNTFVERGLIEVHRLADQRQE